jgi:hypothetical protein
VKIQGRNIKTTGATASGIGSSRGWDHDRQDGRKFLVLEFVDVKLLDDVEREHCGHQRDPQAGQFVDGKVSQIVFFYGVGGKVAGNEQKQCIKS